LRCCELYTLIIRVYIQMRILLKRSLKYCEFQTAVSDLPNGWVDKNLLCLVSIDQLNAVERGITSNIASSRLWLPRKALKKKYSVKDFIHFFLDEECEEL
jgi:hypothetical protein